MHLAGQAGGPDMVGVAIGDVGTGVFAAYASLLGYVKALKTGQGEFIDVSMYDCMIAWLSVLITSIPIQARFCLADLTR